MAETAANLVDRVFPEGVPVRQWVLSFPRRVRYHLARKPELMRAALGIFVDEVFANTRERAWVPRAGQCGGVTAVQRFGSSLNLNVHFHSIMLDGSYAPGPLGGKLVFHEARRPPTREEMEGIVIRVRDRVTDLLVAKGVLPAESEEEGQSEEPDLFDAMQAASIQEMIALSSSAKRVDVLGRTTDGEWVEPAGKPTCARVKEGYSVHANVRIAGRDQEGLERLCGYVLRPPFANGRIHETPDGKVLVELRRPRIDGGTELLFEPLEFMEKLAALVPPPKAHLVRYHGVLAPNARARRQVVERRVETRRKTEDGKTKGSDPRIPWAELLKRTFGVDAMECPRCGHRLRVVAYITDPPVIRRILLSMGLGASAPGSTGPPAAGLGAHMLDGEAGDAMDSDEYDDDERSCDGAE